MINALTDIAGLRVGHATDLAFGTGVTCVLFDQPRPAAVCALGGATGTRDTDLLSADSAVERIDALVLSGGSAFGLDAAGGVQAALAEAGRGQTFAGVRVPLVVQAILFDLVAATQQWGRYGPFRDLGHAAAIQAAGGEFALGSVGAGTGAQTATCKGGVGTASATTPEGHVVAALMAVNALGSVTIGDGPHFWASPFERDGEFGGLGWPARIAPGDLAPRLKAGGRPATTIGVVATDAALTRPQLRRLAIMAHDGLARAVLPAHAPMDGDVVFAVSTEARALALPVAELTQLGIAATLVTARAIARGVFEATRLDHAGADPAAPPAWRDLRPA